MGNFIAYYKSWLYEKKRAIKFGKPVYESNCAVEIDRLEKEHPELLVMKEGFNEEIIDEDILE